MKIFIVVPAWNEEKNIVKTISDLKKYYSEENIVVVDDGSKDKTAELARQNGAVVLRHLINRDQGAALQTGTEYALGRGADIIVHFDADGQHQAGEIAEWIKPIVEGRVEVVLGSRFLGKKSNAPLIKKIFFKLAVPLHNWFVGLGLTDLHNGVRVLSRSAAEKIRITQDHKAHVSDILSQVSRYRLTYQEVPTEIIYHEYGQKIVKGSLLIIKDIFKKIILG